MEREVVEFAFDVLDERIRGTHKRVSNDPFGVTANNANPRLYDEAKAALRRK